MKKLTMQEACAVIRDCLDVVKPSNKKLSKKKRERLNYTLYFLNAFIELQGDPSSNVEAIGFTIDGEDEGGEDTD